MTDEWRAYLATLFPPEILGFKRPPEGVQADLEYSVDFPQFILKDPVIYLTLNAAFRQLFSNNERQREQIENSNNALNDLNIFAAVNVGNAAVGALNNADTLTLEAGKHITLQADPAKKKINIAVDGELGINLLMPATTYKKGDITASLNIPSWADLECITAGKTAATELKPAITAIGQKITDGACIWVVRHKSNQHNIGDIWMYNGAFNTDGFPIHKNTGLVMADCHLCDGTNGTIDMRDKFAMGTDAARINTVGGTNSRTLTAQNMPAHNHTGATNATGGHGHGGSTNATGGHGHTGAATASGSHGHSASGSATDVQGDHGHTYRAVDESVNNRQRYNQGPGDCKNATTSTAGAHSHNVVVAIGNAGDHQHTLTISGVGDHQHTVTINTGGDHQHTVTIGNAGSGAAFDSRPAYVGVAFVQKIY